jgi:hypothetical protein
MKRLHRPDLHGWSRFDEARNLDFHSVLWSTAAGNVAFDPLPVSDHDRRHLEQLGGCATIVITNSDHTRGAVELAAATGARVLGPAGERTAFPIDCDGWIADGDDIAPGLVAMAVEGSKTPGELVFVLESSTLITGDLVRAHEGGRLCLLPDAKLADREAAIRSVERLTRLEALEAVLVGDGWPMFRGGRQGLAELLRDLAPR